MTRAGQRRTVTRDVDHVQVVLQLGTQQNASRLDKGEFGEDLLPQRNKFVEQIVSERHLDAFDVQFSHGESLFAALA